MGSRQENKVRLEELLLIPVDHNALAGFLLAESRLPGPRGNLELLSDLASIVKDDKNRSDLLPIFAAWIEEDAPDHPAAEFLPCCALLGLGGYFLSAPEAERARVTGLIREAANSAEWRVREAVTMALQFVGERDPEVMLGILRFWQTNATLLEQRAIIATIAHPPILTKHPEIADEGLEAGDQILGNIHSAPTDQRKQREFSVLAQGMGFALSVIVAASPNRGFALMRRWARAGDPDITKILKENLKKNRLAKPFASQVNEVSALIESGRP